MRARFAARALAVVLVGNLVLVGALGAQSPAVAGAGRGLKPDAVVALGRGFVDAFLGTLDGGALSLALARAARTGRTLRLLLDPYDKDSRTEGALLAGISSTVQVRWHDGAGRPVRWMDVEGFGSLVWSPGKSPAFRALSVGLKRFNADWDRAALDLPHALPLNEQLRALPDLRERGPHYVRRAGGAP